MNTSFVLVSIEIPDAFHTRAPTEQERQDVAQLIRTLLREALAKSAVSATLGGVIALTPDDVDRLTQALHHEAARRDDAWRKLDAKFVHLRAAIDRIVLLPQETP
jgi:hypothetical protein